MSTVRLNRKHSVVETMLSPRGPPRTATGKNCTTSCQAHDDRGGPELADSFPIAIGDSFPASAAPQQDGFSSSVGDSRSFLTSGRDESRKTATAASTAGPYSQLFHGFHDDVVVENRLQRLEALLSRETGRNNFVVHLRRPRDCTRRAQKSLQVDRCSAHGAAARPTERPGKLVSWNDPVSGAQRRCWHLVNNLCGGGAASTGTTASGPAGAAGRASAGSSRSPGCSASGPVPPPPLAPTQTATATLLQDDVFDCHTTLEELQEALRTRSSATNRRVQRLYAQLQEMDASAYFPSSAAAAQGKGKECGGRGCWSREGRGEGVGEDKVAGSTAEQYSILPFPAEANTRNRGRDRLRLLWYFDEHEKFGHVRKKLLPRSSKNLTRRTSVLFAAGADTVCRGRSRLESDRSAFGGGTQGRVDVAEAGVRSAQGHNSSSSGLVGAGGGAALHLEGARRAGEDSADSAAQPPRFTTVAPGGAGGSDGIPLIGGTAPRGLQRRPTFSKLFASQEGLVELRQQSAAPELPPAAEEASTHERVDVEEGGESTPGYPAALDENLEVQPPARAVDRIFTASSANGLSNSNTPIRNTRRQSLYIHTHSRARPMRRSSAHSSASVRAQSFNNRFVPATQGTFTCGHSAHAENCASARQNQGGRMQPWSIGTGYRCLSAITGGLSSSSHARDDET